MMLRAAQEWRGCELPAWARQVPVADVAAARAAVKGSRDGCGHFLWDAAKAGHVEKAKLWVAAGANINWCGSIAECQGTTPLFEATTFGRRAVVEILIDGGADVDLQRQHHGDTALYEAVLQNKPKIVQLLITRGKANPNIGLQQHSTRLPGHGGRTPLRTAIELSRRQMVEWLIDGGADVHKLHRGATALHAAVLQSHCDDHDGGVVELLVAAAGDRVDDVAASGATALHIAAQNGHAGAVRQLIKAGAKIDKARADNGSTPLCIAACNGHATVVRQLIEVGADIESTFKPDEWAWPPLTMAARNGHRAVVDMLLKAGADQTRRDKRYGWMAKEVADQNKHEWGDEFWYPLHVAASAGDADAVRLGIRSGYNPDLARTDTGETPLYVAAQKGHADLVELLLVEEGVQVEGCRQAAKSGLTPLMEAASFGHKAAVQLLLTYGADPTARSAKTGRTARDLAEPDHEWGDAFWEEGQQQEVVAAAAAAAGKDGEGK